ncbi:hypothetical protein OnM2_055031 [Erysiphe neolycopersici]|uniref:Uncharacterized protein n=1 Tax=Erysiphe neolycopersici TaxID=212602 RepID=A0A420HRB8_9PEZI|nr:hypothetical protein OnM2_055031 [Erysiphe neolycopersici]
MISPSNKGRVDTQRQLRARSLGLGPCVRFSKDAREVLIGRSPVSKNKARSRFSTRKKLHQQTTARISESVSHQPRITIIHQDSQHIIHQRSRAKANKKSRISIARRMSSFGSLRRHISSFSFPGSVSRVRDTNGESLAASERDSEVVSRKSSRKRSIGLSHISSCLRNKLRRPHKSFPPVIAMYDSISLNEVSYPLSKDEKCVRL